ncbi:MAG: hypothetical protein QM541_06435 [Flavobacterium sp.]|nr:hypothetical protein [Flavobacterium sp.]
MNFHLPQFPNSIRENFHLTSPQTPQYNCIAWAFGDNTKWYWPDNTNIMYWPEDVPRNETLESFVLLFSKINYSICDNNLLEIGYEKIAIYATSFGKPTHAARQLSNGFWTSKLGQSVDVTHTLQAMEDGEYGNAVIFMKRPK